MLVRSYSPIGYEGFVDVLGGRRGRGPARALSVELDGAVAALKDSQPSAAADGGCFWAATGAKGASPRRFI